MASFRQPRDLSQEGSRFPFRGPLSSLVRAVGSRPPGTASAPRSEYAAFISYSHRDIDIARWLHKAIEAYRMPRGVGDSGVRGDARSRLRPVFRDEDELGGATELGPEIEAALRASRALVVVCSPDAAASVWVDKEIRTFKRLRPNAPVLAIIARGLPGQSFPDAVRFAVDAAGELDRSSPVEPLAPDLGKVDRRTARLKLIAGIAGVSFADLDRRDLRRRRRIVIALSSAALILIAVLTALTISAIGYARLAVRERNAAEQARASAVRERNEAIAARELAEKRTWLAQQAAAAIRKCGPAGSN